MSDFRGDGLLMRNALLAAGDPADDAEMHSQPGSGRGVQELLTTPALEEWYAADSIAQKVVELIPNTAAGGGLRVTIAGESDKDVDEAIALTSLVRKVREAAKLSRLYYGGSLVLLDVDDGQTWDKPIDETRVRSVKPAIVVGGDKVSFPFDEYNDEGDLEPTWYDVSTTSVFASRYQGLERVHRSRVLFFPGVWTPPDIAQSLGGTISQLAIFWPHYSRFETAQGIAATLLGKKGILNHKRKGLRRFLSRSTVEEESAFRAEAKLRKAMMSPYRMLVSDPDSDEFAQIPFDLNHIDPLLTQFKYSAIAASGGLTELHLFGLSTQTSGLARNDLRDRMIFADNVSNHQEEQWRSPVVKFLRLMFLSKSGPTKGVLPKEWALNFPSTLKLSEVEAADLQSKVAATDKIYFDMGLSAEIILKARFSGKLWNGSLQLPEDFKMEPPAPPAPPAPQQAQQEKEK